jgi:hypothetical protein
LVLGVWHAKVFKKITFSRELVLLMASTRRFGFNNRNFGGFFRARGPKNLFWIAVAKAAA